MSDQHIRFGTTALQVSRLCQGTAFRRLPRADDPRALEVLRHSMERGVNFFDTAQAYGWGGAEQVLGKAVAGRRDQVIICTKVPAMLPPDPDGKPGAPAYFTLDYLSQQLEESLRRLGTDYVDLYLLHQPDNSTAAAEITAAMDILVQSGKTRYWGLSNHSATQVQEYLDLGAPIAGVEEYYNVAGSHLDKEGRIRVRLFEEEIQPVLVQYKLGCLAFSPMDTGLLAQEKDIEAPLASLVSCIDGVAAALAIPRTAVCIAWVAQQTGITSVLAGAESTQHLDDNLLGVQTTLPPEALAALNKARTEYHRALSQNA
jgi:aryl-alcohol dehydrogenase-like predicted oxidoreductase